MTELHATAGYALFGAVGALALLAAVLAIVNRAPRWLEWLRLALTALLALQAAGGALSWLAGARTAEFLHPLYGLAAPAVLPIAATFAAEAPPRPRAAVLALGALVTLALLWRLAATG